MMYDPGTSPAVTATPLLGCVPANEQAAVGDADRHISGQKSLCLQVLQIRCGTGNGRFCARWFLQGRFVLLGLAAKSKYAMSYNDRALQKIDRSGGAPSPHPRHGCLHIDSILPFGRSCSF